MPAFLMPTAPGRCPICATKHELDDAHNQQSLSYQYAFYGRFGRWPTWWDAMVHCDQVTCDFWIEGLKEKGVDVVPPHNSEEIAKAILEWEQSIQPGKLIAMPTMQPIVVQIEPTPDEDDE